MKMYTFLVVAVAVVAVCVGHVPNAPVHRHARQRSSRCMADQFSSVLYDLGSVTTGVIYQMVTQMDYERKVQVTENYLYNPRSDETKTEGKFVTDYNTETMYILPPDEPTVCYKIPYTVPMMQCIPDDAEHLKSAYLGSADTGILPFDIWRFKLISPAQNLTLTLAATREYFVPILQYIADDATNEGRQLMFTNYLPTLTDSSAFTLPPACL